MDVVCDHLICTPFQKEYTFWVHHGESRIGETSNSLPSNMPNAVQDNVIKDPIWNMINDAFGVANKHHANEEPIASNAYVKLGWRCDAKCNSRKARS